MNLWKRTSWVTHVTLVLWIGKETLHKAKALWERPWACRLSEALIESCQFIGWLCGCHLRRSHIVSLYRRTHHLLLRFLCRKGPCRQREELGSKRSVSFPIQRTRVTRVTRDVFDGTMQKVTRHYLCYGFAYFACTFCLFLIVDCSFSFPSFGHFLPSHMIQTLCFPVTSFYYRCGWIC